MKKLILPIGIVTVILLAVAFTLYGNKKKINEANKPVDRTQIPVSVTVSQAQVTALVMNEKYPATVEPFDQANIFSYTSGMIDKLTIELGQHIKKGQVIGKLDTRILEVNLKSALINQNLAELNSRKLKSDYERAKNLYENQAGLEVNMLNAKSSYENALNNEDNAKEQINLIRQQISNATLYSPLSGTVSAKNIKEGEFVGAGVAIGTITNIKSLKATTYVNQTITYQLRLGQSVSLASEIFKEKQFTGKIIYISPVADASHNYQVDLLVIDSQGIDLKAGTDMQAQFNTLVNKNVLQIPKSALNSDRDQPYVYVAENGKVRLKTVKTGIIQNDKVEILSGLQAGQLVVTTGQINLKEASVIRIIK